MNLRHYFIRDVQVLLAISILLACLICVPKEGIAGSPWLDREVVLQDDRYGAHVIEPSAISRTSRGGYSDREVGLFRLGPIIDQPRTR